MQSETAEQKDARGRVQGTPEEPYFVEVDANGCGRCGEGRTWTVVGFAVAIGQSFHDEEDAADAAALMNEAYAAGRGAAAAELLAALKSAVAIASEAHREWDADNDSRVGKILLALAGHRPRYRADIDAIHAAIRGAESL